MKFTIAITCTVVCVAILTVAAITGHEEPAAFAAIGALIGGFASNRFAGETDDSEEE